MTSRPVKPGRRQDGTFAPGVSGNPGGAQAGSRRRISLILDELAGAQAEAVFKRVVEQAMTGDMVAAKAVLDRVWPIPKGRKIDLALPAATTPQEVEQAIGAVADAVGRGEVSAEEGQAVASILDMRRRAIELVTLEARIVALEQKR